MHMTDNISANNPSKPANNGPGTWLSYSNICSDKIRRPKANRDIILKIIPKTGFAFSMGSS